MPAVALLSVFMTHHTVTQNANDYILTNNVGTYVPINGSFLEASSQNGGTAILSLPFTFTFCGVAYDAVTVSIDGSLVFRDGDCTVGEDCYNVLAPFWIMASVESISYVVEGVSPNQVLTVQYQSVGNVEESFSFQVKLYETSNVIEFMYGDGFDRIASVMASIGITNQGLYYTNIIPYAPGIITWSNNPFAFGISTANTSFLSSGTTFTFAPTTCKGVQQLTVNGISFSSVSVSWSPQGEETDWIIEYKKANEIVWNEIEVSSASYRFPDNLDPATTYHVSVRPLCNTDAGTRTMTIFTTNTVFSSLFENFSGTFPPPFWTTGSSFFHQRM